MLVPFWHPCACGLCCHCPCLPPPLTNPPPFFYFFPAPTSVLTVCSNQSSAPVILLTSVFPAILFKWLGLSMLQWFQDAILEVMTRMERHRRNYRSAVVSGLSNAKNKRQNEMKIGGTLGSYRRSGLQKLLEPVEQSDLMRKSFIAPDISVVLLRMVQWAMALLMWMEHRRVGMKG